MSDQPSSPSGSPCSRIKSQSVGCSLNNSRQGLDERRERKRQKKAAKKAARAKVKEEQARVRATVKFLRQLARQGGSSGAGVKCQRDTRHELHLQDGTSSQIVGLGRKWN